MKSVLKTLLALALGLGMLALEISAQEAPAADAPASAGDRPTVAFLGVDPEADPRFSRSLTALIHQDLEADSTLVSLSPRAIAAFHALGILPGPKAHREDVAKLRAGLGAAYYAFAWIEPLEVASKRVIWMPWSVRTTWSQALRLRVLDGATGETVFDGKVPAQVPEKHFWSGPDGDLARTAPVERDGRLRRMLPRLSAEAAKALAKVVADRSKAGEAPADAAAAGQ